MVSRGELRTSSILPRAVGPGPAPGQQPGAKLLLFALGAVVVDNGGMRRIKHRQARWTGVAVAVTVVMCAGAVAEASTPVVTIRGSRTLLPGPGDERDAMASLLSCINEAAKRICAESHHAPGAVDTANRGPVSQPVLVEVIPVAQRRPTALPTIQSHLLNLPPPAAN